MRTKSEHFIDWEYLFLNVTHTHTHNFASSFTKTHIFMQWLIICATSLDMFLFFFLIFFPLLLLVLFTLFISVLPIHYANSRENHQERMGKILLLWRWLFAYWNWLLLPVMSRSLYVMLSLSVCVCCCAFHRFLLFFIVSQSPLELPSMHQSVKSGGGDIYFSSAILERRAKRCQRLGWSTIDCPLSSRWLSET